MQLRFSFDQHSLLSERAWVDMKTYIYSIIVCGLNCGIFSQLIISTKRKKLIQFIMGTVLAITVLHPFSRIEPKEWVNFLPMDSISAEYYISEGKKETIKARKEYIEKACVSYIFDKAQDVSSDLTVRFMLDENLIPISVEVNGNAEPDQKMQIQTILETDLGIPKESQKWILLPENSSS